MQDYRDGDTETINGIPYTRAGGRWIASQAPAGPSTISVTPPNPARGDEIATTHANRISAEARARQALRDEQDASAQTGLSPQALDIAAERYLADGTLTSPGMGQAATQQRAMILNRAAEMAGATGLTGAALADRIAAFRSNREALTNQQRQLSNITSMETTANRNMDALSSAAHNLPLQTETPLLNSIIRTGQYYIPGVPGHNEVAGYNTAYDTAVNEYARLINTGTSGNGELSDAARHQAQTMIPYGSSPAQIDAAIRQARIDMHNRVSSSQDTISGLRRDLGLPPLPTTRGEAPGAPPIPGAGPGGGGPTLPVGGGSAPGGIVNAQSDTAPARAISPQDLQNAQDIQSLYDQGATRAQIDALTARRGIPAFGPELDQMIAYREHGGRGARFNPGASYTPAGLRAAQMDQVQGRMNGGDLFLHGAMGGLGDEAAGIGNAAANILTSPFTGDFSPVSAYETGRDADSIRRSEAADRAGTMGTLADFAGSLASVRPGASLLASLPGGIRSATAPSLGTRMFAGGKAGATVGAINGFGEGRGVGGSMVGAGAGAAGGFTLGAGLPLLGAGARGAGRVGGYLRNLATGNDPNLATRTVMDAISADANTPYRVGQQMFEAQANGVPAMIADSGPNVRGLLAAGARSKGDSRMLAIGALEDRQGGLHDRVNGAIERDLGPITDHHAVTEQLMSQAKAEAGPLYDAAYAAPGAPRFADSVSPLLNRPSMQDAMARARGIAAEEGRDPTALGFEFDPEGNVTLRRGPSWQTLHYVKRGLDDVIEANRHPITGRLNLDEAGRAVNDTQRQFLKAFDAANPAYADARAAYAGPASANSALNRGMKALNMTADDLAYNTANLSPNEMEMFRHGVRRAMAEKVAGLGDNADVTNALVGTGKKRAALAQLFGDGPNFDRFTSTLDAERRGFNTFRQARLGSPTAANLQDDSALHGAIASGAVDLATTGGLPIAQGVNQALRLGRGRVGSNAQNQIVSLLSENSPARLLKLAEEMRRQAAAATAAGNTQYRRAAGIGGMFGHSAGGMQGNH